MSVSYASLQDSILSGDLTSANQLAAQIVGDGTVSHNDFVESLCIQASLAAISGATSASLREITSKLRDAASDTFEQALAQYVEGVVALTVQKAPGIARQRFQTAREIDATFIFARLGLGATDFVEQKFDQCFNHYKNVLRHLGDATPNVIRVVLAVCSFRLKQFDHARRCIVRALAVEPDDPLALLVQFGIQVHFREVTAATRTISALIRIHPTIVVTQKYTDMLFFNALQSKQLAQKSAVILSLIAKTQGLAISANNDALLGYAFMQRGRLLHAEGKLADALDQYNDAIKHNPQLAAAVVHRVQLLHDLKGEAVAREELRVALEKHPRDPEVILMSTVTKASLNQHADAIRQATYLTNTVAREVPDAWSVGAWANRLDSSRYCELATFAQKLLQKAKLPVDIALDANSAVLMGDLDLFAKVASTFLHVDITTTAIEALPVSDESYPYIFNYAFLLEKSDPSKAHKIYRQLVKRCPHEAASLVRLVYMSKEMNRPFEAARWAKLLSLTHPNDRTGLVLLAWVLKEQGHAGEALTIVHEETKVKRDAQLALVTGALFLHDSQGSTHKSDKVTRAMNGFQFALRQDSDNVLAAHGAACCVALQGYSSSAAQILERVAEADCNSNVVKEGIRNHRFNIFVESHAFRSAIGLLGSQPIEKLSRWQCCALATCYARISQHEKALQVLNQALALHHNDASVCYYLVLVLLASVMEALEKTDTLTQERGTEFLERIKRALSLAKYAQRVKSETQRKNLTDIIAFVTSDNLDASVRKRMRDRAREQTHASEMTQRWQMTHQQMIAEEIAQQEAAQRIKEAKLAERTQREAILFDRTQDFINRSYTGVAVEMADPQQDGGAEQPTADALDGTELNAEELAAFMEAGRMGEDTDGAGAAAGIREREGDDELEQPPREQPSAEAENTNIPETLVVNENLQ